MTGSDFSAANAPMADHDHIVWDELAAGAALHALEPDEQQLFDLHVADCDRCVATLGDAELVAAQLGTLSNSSDEFGLPDWSSIGPKIFGGELIASDELSAARQRRANRRMTASRRALTAAAAVVVLAGGTVAIVRATTGTNESKSAQLCQGIVGSCHGVELQTSAGKNFADVVVTNDTAIVKPINAPKAATGKTYVLWQVSDNNKPTEVGRFSASGQSKALLPMPYKSTLVFAVSEESAKSLPSHPGTVLASSPAS